MASKLELNSNCLTPCRPDRRCIVIVNKHVFDHFIFHDSKERGSRKCVYRLGGALLGIHLLINILWHIITPDGGEGVFGCRSDRGPSWLWEGKPLLLFYGFTGRAK